MRRRRAGRCTASPLKAVTLAMSKSPHWLARRQSQPQVEGKRYRRADLQLAEIRMPGIKNVVELPIDHDAGYLQHGRACLPYPLSTELTRRRWSGQLAPILGLTLRVLDELLIAMRKFDCKRAREILHEAVTEYVPSPQIEDLVWAKRGILVLPEDAKVADLAAHRARQGLLPN